MERNVNMEEISDGRLYGLNDMVKADCGDCKGCFACCCAMGSSIILDPLDVHRISSQLGQSFEALLQDKIELHVVDGIILPNLRMIATNRQTERCSFLNEAGRCSIHAFRPGICRIFPLGRIYENHSFQYFLQIHECQKANRTKVKVKKWIDTPEPVTYERFVTDWHYFLKALQHLILPQLQETDQGSMEGGLAKTVSLYVLQQFYQTPFDQEQSFYPQFQERLRQARQYCSISGAK